MKTTTKTKAPRYAVLRETIRGKAWYQARDVGCVTLLATLRWTTTDRAAADRMADNEGGEVVTLD